MPTRPNRPKAETTRRWRARALATSAADLDVHVDAAHPAAAIDALLIGCLHDDGGRSPDIAEVRSWSVADRLDALLEIHLAAGVPLHPLALRCPAARCGADFEAELDLAACRRPQPVPSTVTFEVDGRSRRARLPTGAEHEAWQRQSASLHLVAAALIEANDGDAAGDEQPAGETDDTTLRSLDAALAAHDTMRTLALDLACPECGEVDRHTVELEPLLLASLADRHAGWLAEIADVAAALHWSESAIAAMPGWRRQHYLRHLAAAGHPAGTR